MVDGRASDRVRKLVASPGWQQAKPEEAAEMLVPVLGRDYTAIRRTAGDRDQC